MANELANVNTMLLAKLNSEDVVKALPRDINKERFIQNALSVVYSNSKLQEAVAKNPARAVMGMVKGAFLGLDFMSSECYLIPYGNDIQFQTSYKGEVKLVRKYSKRPIRDIYAKAVREGDDFEESIIDGQPSITFKPMPFNDNPIVGVFAVCLFEDGGMIYETMSRKDVESVRNNYSKMKNSSTWINSYEEMAKKVVIRRLTKHITIDFDTVEAQKSFEEGSGMDFSRNKVSRPKATLNDILNVDNEAETTNEEVADEDAIEVEAREVFSN